MRGSPALAPWPSSSPHSTYERTGRVSSCRWQLRLSPTWPLRQQLESSRRGRKLVPTPHNIYVTCGWQKCI